MTIQEEINDLKRRLQVLENSTGNTPNNDFGYRGTSNYEPPSYQELTGYNGSYEDFQRHLDKCY